MYALRVHDETKPSNPCGSRENCIYVLISSGKCSYQLKSVSVSLAHLSLDYERVFWERE